MIGHEGARPGTPRENGLWAVAQQVVSLALTGVFSIVLVRFVSVAEFGLYSYALTLASLGVAVMVSGLQGLAVRELHTRAHDTQGILSALFLIREIMALSVYIVFTIFTLSVSESTAILPTLVACLAVLARVLDAPEVWFQATLRARFPAAIRIGSALVFFVLRLTVVIFAPSIIGLLVLFVIEQLINGGLIARKYWRTTRSRPYQKAKAPETLFLARKATPLALSGIANQINLRVDVVIIQALSGSTSVGLYAAASRVSELLYAFPTAYMNATFPSLLEVRRRYGKESSEYRRNLQRGFDTAFWFGVIVVLGTVLTADWIVPLVFGPAYEVSAEVLKVHVLACPFMFMAAILSKWIVAEDKLWISLVRHGVGAALSIGLNIVLIPEFGIVGSAWATVVSYASASYVFCFFSRGTTRVAWMMTLTPFAPVRYLYRWISRNGGTT